jgi:MFS family permease
METPMIIYPESRTIYRTDPYRLVVLVIFCFYCGFVGLLINPYAPVAQALNIAYGISIPQIKSTMICFLFGKIISAAFSGIVLERIGIKAGIYVAILLMVFGCFLRMQLETAFELVLLGQFTLGLSAAVIVTSQLKLLYEWCHPHNRGYFTTIVSFSFTIGGGVGLVFILFFVRDTEIIPEIIKEQIGSFDKAHLVLVLLLAIVHTLFFLSKPRTGYGYIRVTAEMTARDSELVKETENAGVSPLSITEKLRNLFSQPIFRKYLVIYVGVNCVNNIVMSDVAIIYEEFGIQGALKGIMIGVVLVCGVIGSMRFMQIYLPSADSGYYFTNSLLFSLGFLVVGVTFMAWGFPLAVIMLLQGCFGLTFFLSIPVCQEYIMRNVRNIPLTFLNGFLFFLGQSSACIFLLIDRAFFEIFHDHKRYAIYSSTAMTSVLILAVAIFSRR